MVTLKVCGFVLQYRGCSSGVVLGHGFGNQDQLERKAGGNMGVLGQLERDLG
jgi:hypothetical protein